MKVPGVLEPWSDKEIAALHKSIEGSMGEIYQRYNQSKIPVGALSVTAMQSPDKEVTLLVMIMQLPRQEGLFAQLRGEAADKAKWGIQQGFITRASKTVAIEKKDYEGFYLTMAHADKSLDSVAGLMHKDHQGQMVNIQLKASVASKWTEAQLEKRLLEITESLQLK